MGRKRSLINNSGMTLVELMIAVVILAVIVVPLLHAFVSASNVSRQAKERLRVTTAAQDIMEGLKAETLESFAYGIYYPAGYSDATTTHKGFTLLDSTTYPNTANLSEIRCTIDSAGGVSGIVKADDSLAATNPDDGVTIKSTDSGKTYEFVRKADGGKYYFAIPGVNITGSPTGNFSVDVLIEVDASKYRDGSTITNASARHNSIALADLAGLDNTKDCILAESTEQTNEVINKMNIHYGTSYTADDIYKKIDVRMYRPVGGLADQINILETVQYISKVNSSHVNVDPVTCSGYSTDDTLNGIYLMYYPSYNGETVSHIDEINFANEVDIPVDLYVIKKQSASDATLGSDESSYRCKVSVTDGDASKDVANKVTTLRTNLDYNMKFLYDITANPVLMTPLQAQYQYNGSPIARDALKVEDLGGKMESDRIYDANVYVYESGSLGSTSIDSDKLLMKLSGSMK